MMTHELFNIPVYWLSFVIALIIVGIMAYKIIRIFLDEGVITHIKDDWSYRLPNRIRYNRYRGLSRPAYGLLCVVYYSIKTLFLLVLALEFYCLKFFVWDIWKWTFQAISRLPLADSKPQDYAADFENIETKPTVNKLTENKFRNTGDTMISNLWNNGDEKMWKTALKSYWDLFNEDQFFLEKEIELIRADDIQSLTVDEFYDFLYQRFYPWKFTNKLFLSRNRRQLEKYLQNDEIEKLAKIQENIFCLDFTDIKACLSLVSRIHGLGTGGSSGLLAILYPEQFGTVDRFMVSSLLEIKDLPEYDVIAQMNPMALTANDGAVLIQLMRNKAQELNERFHTNFWTPRKIDMVLWANR